MDEARAVLARLERIERSNGREELLAELRELVREVEAWTSTELRVLREADATSCFAKSSRGGHESRLRWPLCPGSPSSQ